MPHPTISIPGFRVERRSFLSAAAVGALLRPTRCASDETALSFEAFAEKCEQLAEEHIENRIVNADAYLHDLARLGTRLSTRSVPRPELSDFGGYDPPVSIRPVHRTM